MGFLWLGENPDVAENRALYERGVGLIEEYEEAERDCANRINSNVEDRTRFESMPSDGELDDEVFYHGYQDDLSDLATDWDSGPAGTDLPWWTEKSDCPALRGRERPPTDKNQEPASLP